MSKPKPAVVLKTEVSTHSRTPATPAVRNSGSENSVLDFIGIGFGPSNLALAVAAREIDANAKGLFFEQSPSFRWHSGMMLDGTTMQISFLKDLATLRNPASPYTFLQYTKAKGRLERFINLREFNPTRVEFEDYLRWVADAFSDEVRYGSTVTSVSPVTRKGDSTPWCFRVEVRNIATDQFASYLARNVVYSPGGKPRIPEGMVCDSQAVIHSSEFLPDFQRQFKDSAQQYSVLVVGGGQSAAEIVAFLLDRYPRTDVHWLLSGCAPRATDASSFVNEQFGLESLDAFYNSSKEKRAAILDELRNTNYGVVESGLIEDIYRKTYQQEVKGEQRLFVHSFSRLIGVEQHPDRQRATFCERFDGPERELFCDGVVLATGYERSLDPAMFADMLPFCETDADGQVVLSRRYRVRTISGQRCGLYVQGLTEDLFGQGETLLSLLPLRAKEIFEDILEHRPATAEKRRSKKKINAQYPPPRYLEHATEKLYAVVERFRFATLISVPDDEPIVTQVPLILDRSRGSKGVLFGHMDRANPHVDFLERGRVMALFHGPNSFISPDVYTTDRLPTWNSITVHVRGRTRLVSDQDSLVGSLCSIAEKSDVKPGAFRLRPDDPRIGQLLKFIVGFEIDIEEITGRFKLSQDCNESDRRRAAFALALSTELGDRDIIENVIGLSLMDDDLGNTSILRGRRVS